MTAEPLPALLVELARAGVRLKLVGDDRIEVTASSPLTVELRDRIREHKPQLVTWLGQARPDGDGAPGVVARPDQAAVPFAPSDLQQSFLVGSTEGMEYHVRPHQYMEFEYDDLDPVRWERALNQALHRQRANLVVVGEDMRLHAVAQPQPVRVPVHDLRGLPTQEAEARLGALRAAMRRRQLPLDRWPWMDIEISRYGADRTRLHYNNNNFFSDGLGTFRFLDSVRHYYDHPDRPLPPLAVSYRDCLAALAAVEESARGEASRRYWYERIPHWPGPPELPLVGGVDTRVRSRLRRRELHLDAPLWTALKAKAAGYGLTPSSVLCAGYAEVIAYWSGSRHFLLNNMISRRRPLHPDLPEVIGNFAALYPLEVDWRPVEGFADRARRLQRQVVADLEQVHWSGVKVLQELNRVAHTPGRAVCPFAVGSALSVGGTHLPAYSLLETPQTLLDCEFWESERGALWVVWDVIEEMFPAGLVDAMHEGYRALLVALAADDGAWQQTAFELLPTAQREERERVNLAGPVVEPHLLHEPLARLAGTAPTRTALVCPDAVLDYAELHRRSSAVTARLRRLGVRPGDLVAVAADKGWQQTVAVLGTLGAGAAYLPVDPQWPVERLRYLLEQTAAVAVLAGSGSASRLAGLAGTLLVVDDLDDAVGSESVDTPPPGGDLAYVIYTSGSTGRPKGVMVEHRAALNTVLDVNRRFGVSADDVVFGISSLCFDLSVYDIAGPLWAGASLVLPGAGRDEPAHWLELVREHGVTVWNSVPALLQLLVEEASAAGVSLPTLRLVLLSGDWIPVDLPARLAAVAPNARVVSLGGATEAAIWSIAYPVEHVNPGWVSIPYGRPLANQSWHVLDGYGRDAPVWTPGELHIGGAGLALGYLNDAERTAAAFVTHPRTGERLYRTGDLGRYRPDGEIELLGRVDFQVKIQGYRVEPGEIEHALLDCAGVAQAAVVAHQAAAGKRLVGFVTADPDRPAPVPAQIREQLSRRLPGYLVPDTVQVLPRMPLGANGKVDRRALAELAAERPTERPVYVPARTATERVLVDVWQEVLTHAPVGIHDSFFDLGGNSLAGLRAIRLIGMRLGQRVPLGTLLRRPTVAGLAGSLAGSLAGEARAATPLVWLRETGTQPPWFFVHPAGGAVLCYAGLARLLGTPFAALEAEPPAEYATGAVGQASAPSVEALAKSYVDAIRDAWPGPYRLGGWSSGAVIALEMARQLRDQGESVSDLVVVDAPAPPTPREVQAPDLLRWFVEDLDLGLDAQMLPEDRLAALARLPGPAALEGALALAAEHGLTDPPPGAAELVPTLAVFDRVVRACAAYRPAQVDVDILVIRATDGMVSEFAAHPAQFSPDWGWSALTTGRITAVTLPGTHHTVLDDAHVPAVARLLAGRYGTADQLTQPAA